MSKIAAVLIRGTRGMRQDVKDTLYMLRLRKKNACIIFEDTVQNRGMLQKAKDFITYGPVADETQKKMTPKKTFKNLTLYGLHPPRGGFERKGIKKPFTDGGALGFRKEMDSLLGKMINEKEKTNKV